MNPPTTVVGALLARAVKRPGRGRTSVSPAPWTVSPLPRAPWEPPAAPVPWTTAPLPRAPLAPPAAPSPWTTAPLPQAPLPTAPPDRPVDPLTAALLRRALTRVGLEHVLP